MFCYPVILEPDGDTVMVTSPDFPQLGTFGDDRADALANAQGALVAVISEYMDRRMDIPEPSHAANHPVVTLPTLVAAKVALYRAMREQGVTQKDLAARLRKDDRQVRRLLDVTNSSRQGDLDAALNALGQRLEIRVRRCAYTHPEHQEIRHPC